MIERGERKERERESVCVFDREGKELMCVCVCVCVCVGENDLSCEKILFFSTSIKIREMAKCPLSQRIFVKGPVLGFLPIM